MLKSNILATSDNELRERLDVMLSSLYLFALNCQENKLNLYYSELTILSKIKKFPLKIIEKLIDCFFYWKYKIAKKVKDNIDFRGKIVFFPVEPTHVRQMLPVSNQLVKSDYLYITDRLRIYVMLAELNIKCLLIPVAYGHKKFEFDYLTLGKGFIPNKLSEKWQLFCEYQIENRFDEIELSISNAIDLLQPLKLVIGYDITAEGRFCVKYCNKIKIPTYCIQHGSIAGEPLDGEHIVDNYILYGDQAKDYLIKIGNKPEILKVFGAPYLNDEIVDAQSKKEVFELLNLTITHKTILIALSGPGHCTSFEHFNQIVKSLVEYAKQNSDVNLIFKLHRKDSPRNYEAIFSNVDFFCPVIESNDKRFPDDIFYWLSLVDALITGSSTVALEAMLKGKPVVTIDYKNQYQNIDFIDLHCTYHVTAENELTKTLGIALNTSKDNKINTNAKQYINKYFYTEEKPASLRIAEWLMSAK